MHGSMSAAGGNQASRPGRAAPAPPADPTATIPIAHYRILSKEQLAATARLVAKRSRGVNDRHDRGVAIGIASSRRAGTIALQECDRRAAGAIQRSRTAEFGRTQAPATDRVTAQVGLLLL